MRSIGLEPMYFDHRLKLLLLSRLIPMVERNFQPLPDSMQDMALIDRFHFYMPGWETPKMQTEFFTEQFGFVVDYLVEAFKELRKLNFTDAIDAHFSLGSHLNARDAKAVRKTVSGLLKLLHPDGNYTIVYCGLFS